MKIKTIFLLFCVAFYFVSCANEPTATTAPTPTIAPESNHSSRNGIDAPADMGEAMEQLSDVFKGLKNENGEKVEVVNFRTLKEKMPATIAGMSKENAEGQTTGIAGFKVSNASAEYKSGDKRIDVNLTDTGGLGSALMGMAAWSQLEIDKETSDGYERTTIINGHKAFQKYNTKTKKSELAVLVNNRFLVAISGKNAEMSELEAALSTMNLEGLE